MMKIKTRITALVSMLALATLVLSACGPAAPVEPTLDPNMVFTQVAETVMVSMTQTAQAVPPTSTPEPTATAAPTQPPAPTTPPQPVNTPMPAGPTPTIQRFGDSAKWNTQSPADGKVFKPSENFPFHVCLGNNGSSEWHGKYYLQWVSGYSWTKQTIWYVGDITKPGGTWCFDIPGIAPNSPGSYISRWYFKNPDGVSILEVYFAYKVQA